MNWVDASEIVTGLVLSKKQGVNSVRAETFISPYNEIIKLVKSGTNEIEDIIEKIGLSPVQAALESVKNINGLGDRNWVKILEDSAVGYDAGAKLEKFGKKLQDGDNVDWSMIKTISSHVIDGNSGGFTPLSEIKPGETPYKLTGFKSIDIHLGGLPIVGQVIVAAPPGTGKTTFMTDLAACWAKTNKQDRIAIFTLEMMKEEIAMRFNEMPIKMLNETKSRIQIEDAVITPEEVVAKASTIEHLGLVCIDFADLLIKGETTESAMAHIYRTFMLGAKQLGCPVVLLSQLNRGYSGGIPRPNDIRYTGLAEALGWMILMLYNPSADWFAAEDMENVKNDKTLVPREGTAYIICWKCRGGFRMKKPDEVPGAIEIPFNGKKGWKTQDEGRWHSLRKF